MNTYTLVQNMDDMNFYVIRNDVNNEEIRNPVQEHDPDRAPDNTRWTHNAILALIDQYDKQQSMFNSTIVRKETVWKTISNNLKDQNFNYSHKQCEFKFKNLKKQYFKKLDNMKATQSGAGRINFQYFDEFHNILGKMPNAEPVAICSSMNPNVSNLEEAHEEILEHQNENTQNSVDQNRKRKRVNAEGSKTEKKKDKIIKTLELLHKEREEARERRHREMLHMQKEITDKFCDTLNSLLHK